MNAHRHQHSPVIQNGHQTSLQNGAHKLHLFGGERTPVNYSQGLFYMVVKIPSFTTIFWGAHLFLGPHQGSGFYPFRKFTLIAGLGFPTDLVKAPKPAEVKVSEMLWPQRCHRNIAESDVVAVLQYKHSRVSKYKNI